MVAPAIVAGAARGAAFARPVVMGSMKKTMQSTARGGARAGSKSAVRGSAGTGTAMKQMLNASMIQDSMSLLETVEQVSGSKPVESKKVLGEIRDGIIKLGTIFTNKISGLNSHLAFRLDKLNTTMTTIGKVLAADLDLEKKSFDDANKDQAEEDRKKSLEDETKEKKSPTLFGSIFSDLKEGFNSIIDFFTPKSDLAKVGLAGLAVLAVFAFRDKIEETFTKVFAYLDTLKEAFKEGGFKGLGNKIQEDIKKNIINPTLSSIGLRVKEDGTIGLVQGSFLDKVNPFGGPTNIFKTLNAFRTGINPYDNNSKMYPEWYYKGFMENLNDLLTPEDPDMLVNAIKNTMNAITKGISEFFTDTEISTPDGTYTQKSGMSEMKDQMMENFRNNVKGIKEFFHDEDGNLFGIDFKALKDLLPTIQEIAESIYNALPQWARPDTLAEKNVDRDIERLKDIDFFEKDYAIQKSEIDRSKIDQASPEELKSLLSKESDDLRPADIQFIENKIIEKERLLEKTSTTDLSSFTTTETSKLKTESLKKLVDEKAAINDTPPGNVTVMTDAKKVSTIHNSSKTDVIANDFRTDSMELSAQEQMNFFRTSR